MHVNDLFVISPGHNQTYQLVKAAILDAADMYRKHNKYIYIYILIIIIIVLVMFQSYGN